MNYINSQACIERLGEVEKEYIQACDMISRGRTLPLTNQLREALGNIAQEEVQGALNDEEVCSTIWAFPQDIESRYALASFVGRNRVVFNIKGNAYRLIVSIAYRLGIIYIKFVGTHAEYDKINAETVELE